VFYFVFESSLMIHFTPGTLERRLEKFCFCKLVIPLSDRMINRQTKCRHNQVIFRDDISL